MTPFDHHPHHAEKRFMQITATQKNIRVQILSKFSKFVCVAWPEKVREQFFLSVQHYG